MTMVKPVTGAVVTGVIVYISLTALAPAGFTMRRTLSTAVVAAIIVFLVWHHLTTSAYSSAEAE